MYFCSKTLELDPLSRSLDGYTIRLADTPYLSTTLALRGSSTDSDYLFMGFVNEGYDPIQSIDADPSGVWTPATEGQTVPDWYDPVELERQAQWMGYHAVTVMLVGERKSILPSAYTRVACGRDWSTWNFAKVEVGIALTMRSHAANATRMTLTLPPVSLTSAPPGMGELTLPPSGSRKTRIE